MVREGGAERMAMRGRFFLKHSIHYTCMLHGFPSHVNSRKLRRGLSSKACLPTTVMCLSKSTPASKTCYRPIQFTSTWLPISFSICMSSCPTCMSFPASLASSLACAAYSPAGVA